MEKFYKIYAELKGTFPDMTTYEICIVATKIHQNLLFAEANVLGFENTPSALEKIAMELANIDTALSCFEKLQ